MTIKTKEDWWEALEKNWVHMVGTIPMRLGYNLTDLATHNLRKDGNVLESGHSYFEDLMWSKERNDWERVYTYLNAFWAAAPDEPWIHEIPGWGVLCDLCSEIYVFDDK